MCSSQVAQGKLQRHHIDFNHNNNDPKNVVYLCKRCHDIINQTGYMSRDEMLELNKKIHSDRNDPFAPKRGSHRVVFCLHCHDVYLENEVKWDSESEMCRCKNHPDCSGAGICFYVIREDEMGEEGFQTKFLDLS